MSRRTPQLATSRRALIAGGVGNVVEWYDFAVYGAFATVIATTYFPGADPIAGLSASFAVFATAFLARPVGTVVFGRLGDRVGRRQVLVTVIVLMAAATAGIGLLPGHAAIGVLAPVLLVVFRAAQGLSVGGEAAGATAFVVEYAPEGRRGWYGSWLWSTLALGVAGGIGVAVLLARVFPREVLEDRGWRLAFLVALPLGLVGLYLRLRLDETPRFRALERADAIVRRPVAATLRTYPGRLLLGLAPWPRPWRRGRPRSSRWTPPTCPRRSWPGPEASASSLPGDASRARQGFHAPMGIEPYPTPEDRLRALADGQASVLESLAHMQMGALERSRLDRETYLLVRLAALVATDAAAVSYRAHLSGPGEPGLPVAKIIGAFEAIAPFVGSARVLSAASRLDLAGLLPAGPRRITPSG